VGDYPFATRIITDMSAPVNGCECGENNAVLVDETINFVTVLLLPKATSVRKESCCVLRSVHMLGLGYKQELIDHLVETAHIHS